MRDLNKYKFSTKSAIIVQIKQIMYLELFDDARGILMYSAEIETIDRVSCSFNVGGIIGLCRRSNINSKMAQ